MTEPSQDAVEALALMLAKQDSRKYYAPQSLEEAYPDPKQRAMAVGRSLIALRKAQPIIEAEARNRWEQEVRERALSNEIVNTICDLSSFPSHFDHSARRRDVRNKLEHMFNSIFGEAEPEGESDA